MKGTERSVDLKKFPQISRDTEDFPYDSPRIAIERQVHPQKWGSYWLQSLLGADEIAERVAARPISRY